MRKLPDIRIVHRFIHSKQEMFVVFFQHFQHSFHNNFIIIHRCVVDSKSKAHAGDTDTRIGKIHVPL